MDKLPVIFRAERSAPFRGEVTAVFPTLAADNSGHLMTVYAHVGQHSGGDMGWYQRTVPASPAAYADLLAEVRSIYEQDGDCELVVCKRITGAMRAERRA